MPREAEFVICEQSIHHYFRTWRIDGTWKEVHSALRERLRVHIWAEILNRVRA